MDDGFISILIKLFPRNAYSSITPIHLDNKVEDSHRTQHVKLSGQVVYLLR